MTGNKDKAVEFLERVAKGDVHAAYGALVAPDFRHHNPYFRGDAKSLEDGMAGNAAQFPDKQLTVLRAVEEGDLVAVHSRVHHVRGDRGHAVVHIFRFEGGRIAELWDVGQSVPEESPNEYGMF
jgi:predicted SnoaL-like aldol condensation-catalyzing enzyme